MNPLHPCFKLLGMCCAVAIFVACEENDGGQAPLQPIATLPQEFVDTLGRTWLCEQPRLTSTVSGTVSLENPPSPPQNTDILHLALFEQGEDAELRSISSYCINNITRLPVNFNLPYNPTDINGQRTYGISANYFELIGGNLYEASHKFDGLKPVISNGVTTQVDIVLPAAAP